MKNIIRQTTEFAMHIVRAYVKPGDTVVDATCGNGHDTLALASMEPARLYAFDVQETAVHATTALLEANGYTRSIREGRIVVKQLAHEEMAGFVAAPVKVVVFNLGYLPGGDKTITTRAETTLSAVQGAMELLQPDGLICITMYSGHDEGKREKESLLDLAEMLDAATWHTAFISMLNQKHNPPEILLITRKK